MMNEEVNPCHKPKEEEEVDVTLPSLRFLTGEALNICRLCCAEADTNSVTLDESRQIQCYYFVNTVTFMDMLADLGMKKEPALPQMLCANCADFTINSFLFQKLCHHSDNKWHEILETTNKALCQTIAPTVKTAYYLILGNKEEIMLTSKRRTAKTKQKALCRIRELLRSRQIKKANKESSVSLAKHIRIHSTDKFPCSQCAKIFSTPYQVKEHKERVHCPKIIQCPKCAKLFSTEKMLKYHDAQHHTVAICKDCSIHFPSKRELQKHLDKHGLKKCPRCDKEFLSKQTFQVHVRVCGREDKTTMKFICDICQKVYMRKNGLKSHLITEHGFGTVYTCNWCRKPFDAISKLNLHIVKHTKERNFHCDQCGGLFVTQAALVYHTRIHTGERPFPCDMCNESFLNTSRRMEHKRRKHLGPNRECPVCHAKFVTSHELKKHEARHKNPQSKLFVAENDTEQ